MDNQQERPAEVLSEQYVAGLVAGEGWFGLGVQKNPRLKTKHGFVILPRFAISMNDQATMELVGATFKEWQVGHRVYTKNRSKENPKWSDSYRIELAGCKRLRKLISILLPHLTGTKKEAASIVLEFIELRFSKPQASPYGEDEVVLVNRLREVNGGNRGNKHLLESSETIRRTVGVPSQAKI